MVLQLRTDICARPCSLLLFSVACSPTDYKTCYAKQASKTVKWTVAGGDATITKIKLVDGYPLDADVINFGVTGKPLQALLEDQPDGAKGGLMANALCEMIFPENCKFPLKPYSMLKVKYVDHSVPSVNQVVKITAKVARVKQPVAILETAAELGTSGYSNLGTKTVAPLLRVPTKCQMWLFWLVIFLSVSQVLSFTKDERAEIGSCRFDKTSLATLSCVEPDGKWRPPSMTCCNALLYAIDHLPASNESGACCLCRYIHLKYPNPGLATSYVLCQGIDRNIVTRWSFPLQSCYTVCHQRNAGMDNPGQKDGPVVHVHGTGSSNFKTLWIAAAAAAFCVFLLAYCWYLSCYKPVAKSLPFNPQRQGLSPVDSTRAGRRRSRRRMSPSPNG